MHFRLRPIRFRLLVVACSILMLEAVVTPPVTAQAASSWSIGSRAAYAPSGPGLYAYAPSAISSGGSTYYYTCHNSVPGVIQDSVWLAQVSAGRLASDQAVLAPSPSGWDSHHVCDPSVVAGRFGFAGATFGYAMFYLGTPQDNTDNQIGVAFADDLAGPWVQAPAPVVQIPRSASSTWGVGQPSATTIDPATGSVALFYTDGTSGTVAYRRHLVLGDGGHWGIGDPEPVTTAGLGGDVLHNFDVAYDPQRDRFYIARAAGPAPTSAPTNISTGVEVDSISGADLWGGTGAWRLEGQVGPALTHLPRNHDPGIVRTAYGTLPHSGSIDVVITGSTTGDAFPGVLFSYDLWTVSGSVS